MSIRRQKRLIALAYHSLIFVLFVIGVNTENSLPAVIGILDALTFKLFPLVRSIQQKIITAATCPGCQKQIELISNWQCSCGYICQERYIFQPCKQCGKVFSFIKCECGATVLI